MNNKQTFQEFITKYRELEGKATPGKWRSIPGDTYCAYPNVISENKKCFIIEDHTGHEPGDCEKPREDGFPGANEDAEFISESRNIFPALLSALEVAMEALTSASIMADEDGEIPKEAITKISALLNLEGK